MARSKRTEPTKQEDLRERYIDQTGEAPPRDTEIAEESDGTVSAVSPADQSPGPESVNDTANLDAIPERVGVDPAVMDAVRPSQGVDDRLGVDPVGIDGGDMTSLDSPADAMGDRATQMDDMRSGVDEFMLDEGVGVGVGGLDGRNDAAGYGGTGATTPTEGAPDSADALGTVGDSLREYQMDKLQEIQNDSSLTDSEQYAKMDALANDVQAVKDNTGSPDTGEGGVVPPAGAGGTEAPPDGGEDEGGGWLSDAIDTVVEAAGYDSENFWGDSGSEKPGGGMIGGQSLTGAEEGLDLSGPEATASQDEVEKAANDALAENDTTTTTDDDAADDPPPADPPPADPPPKEDMAPESDPGIPLDPAWQGLVDENADQTSEANLGADINYGDQVQGAVAEYVMVDTDQLTGQFDPDYADGQSGDTEAAAAMLAAVDPSDEFMDT